MCTGWNGAGSPSSSGTATTTHERDLGAQVERDGAPQLGGQPATALDGADDRRVRVVEEHQVGRLAGEVGSARAHGDADVRRGERRRVVDAVAGDGDDLAPVLEDLHEPQLVLGRGARDDGLAAEPVGELVVVERVERRAAVQHLGSSSPASRAAAATVARVVAADDDRPHPGVGEHGHGVAHPGAQRVAEGDQPHERQVALGVGGIARNRVDAALGHRDDSQPVIREPRDLREHGRPLAPRTSRTRRASTSGAPLTATHAPPESRHTALSRLRTGSNG